MNERKEYNLIVTYLYEKYFISTAYRRASTPEEMWYFETIIWEWNKDKKERGEILEIENSGISEKQALDNHYLLIKKMQR